MRGNPLQRSVTLPAPPIRHSAVSQLDLEGPSAMAPTPRRRSLFRSMLCAVAAAALAGCDTVQTEVAADVKTDKTHPPLSTGRHIDSSGAQSSQGVGHMPVNVLLSHDG